MQQDTSAAAAARADASPPGARELAAHRSATRLVAQLAVAFFLSGFAALLCQVVWQRMLGLFSGSDTVAAALVTGAFLTGLGIGALTGSRIADRLSPVQALFGFIAAECGVAAFALASRPFLYDWLAIEVAGKVEGKAAIFALCFAGLVVPTTLMGASLPLLSRIMATSLDHVAGRIAILYAMNTIGAGLGALFGGWVVLGLMGFENTLRLAAAIEVLAALVALAIWPSMRGSTDPAQADRTERLPQAAAVVVVLPPTASAGLVPLWCLLAFASGFVIVALEIVWMRVIGQFGQYSAYLFSTVLGVFLLADGAGMAAGARLLRHVRDPRAAFFLAQGGGFVLAALLLLALWAAMPHWPIHNDPTWVDAYRFNGLKLIATVAVTVLAVGPPAFLIGMTFAFIQRAVQRDLTLVGARVGWVQLANIAGNAAGSLGTGLVALHVIGTAGTLRALGVLTLVLLALWLWRMSGRERRPGLVLAAMVMVLVTLFPDNDAFWRRMHGSIAGQPVAWAEDRSGVAFFRDDRAVAHYQRSEPWRQGVNPFFTQGYAQGGVPPLAVHLLLGAMGPLLHPDPQRVMVVGMGAGGTPWAAGIRDVTREIHVVELVAPVLTVLATVAQREPDGAIAKMLADPRWRIATGDARRVLARGDTGFDVILSDAILPEASQSGSLYSAEFLRLVRTRLKPGGLYVQWTPTVRSIQTVTAGFAHALLLMPASVTVASDRPIETDMAALLAKLEAPGAKGHLSAARADCCEWRVLLRGPSQVWTPDNARPPAPLIDLFPRDEFYLNNPVLLSPEMATPAVTKPTP